MSTSSIPPSVPPGLEFNATLGALEVGVLVSTVLFGILVAQMHTYFLRFPNDPTVLKALVLLVWLLELAHMICDAHALYTWTILDFGNVPALLRTPVSIKWTILISGCIVSLAQAFFAWRILRFANRWYIPVVCWTLSLYMLVGSIFITVQSLRTFDVDDFTKNWGGMVMSILTVGAFTDLLITVSLSYYLRKERGKGLKRTARLLDQLVKWTIQTGLLTSMTAVVTMICFQVVQKTFIWLGVFALSARLYANSFLALLNARSKIRDMMKSGTHSGAVDVESCDLHSTNWQFRPSAKAAPSRPQSWSIPLPEIGLHGLSQSTSKDGGNDGNNSIKFAHAL